MRDPGRVAQEHFAQGHIDDAIRFQSGVAKKRSEDADESDQVYERFYNNLALFSGGTIALSVTYLGYLKTTEHAVFYKRVLMASWATLLVCLSMFFVLVFFCTHYGHYFRHREYAEATRRRYQTELDEFGNLDVVNLKTREEIEAFKAPRLEAVKVQTASAAFYKAREKRYQLTWVWMGRIARIAFLSGIVLLLAFAIANS